ncbi:hypothetical protein Hdeb2414_s0008g00269341 [Helianthus debilis subsp. tardiflorus]
MHVLNLFNYLELSCPKSGACEVRRDNGSGFVQVFKPQTFHWFVSSLGCQNLLEECLANLNIWISITIEIYFVSNYGCNRHVWVHLSNVSLPVALEHNCRLQK